MKINKLITVIVPIYNNEQYIETCVNSIIKQTYQNLEIILVDDGTPDNCGTICDEYAKRDNRINVIHQKNQGVSQSRNNAIKIAKGEYITFVDADDWVDEKYIEILYNLIIQGEANISVISNDEIINDKIVQGKVRTISEIFDTEGFLKEVLQERVTAAACWGKLFERKLFINRSQIFDVNIKIAEDLKMIIPISEECEKIIVDTHYKLYHYRINKESVTKSTGNRSLWLDEIKICDDIIQFIKDNHPKIEKYAIQRYVRANITFMMQMIKENHTCLEKDFKQYKKNVKKYKLIYLLSSATIKNKILLILFYFFPQLTKSIYQTIKHVK